jgi:hypothetical protein
MTPLYRETLARCSKAGQQSQFKGEVRAIWSAFSFQTARDGLSQGLQVVSLNPSAIATVIQDHGLTEKTNDTLNSPDFYQALNDCYGNSLALKHAYIAGLISSDVAGKVVAVGIAVAAGWATVKIVGAATAAYPMLRYGLMAAAGAGTSYQIYVALHETLRSPNAAERAQAAKLIAQPLANANANFVATETLLRTEIVNLKQSLPSKSGDDLAATKRRIILLSSHLDKLQSLENPNSLKG